MRTIIDLPDEQLDALARICEEQKISRAEAVRRAVNLMIQDASVQRPDVGFGIWSHKRIDARKYVERTRKEWL